MLTLQKVNDYLLKQLFHITQQPAEAQPNDVLLMEVGEDYSCVAHCNATSKVINEISYYTFTKGAFEEVYDIGQQVKSASDAFDKVVVCPAFPQALLVPDKFFTGDNNQSLLQTVYDVTGHTILHDPVNIWHLHNVYAFPQALHQSYTEQFGSLTYVHAYTAALKNDNTITEDHQITVHFNTTHFRVKVKKGQTLLLMQTFSFQTPLDVVYVLLKICAEMELKQEETNIILSGLIDEQSDLYKELYNYFIHLHFATVYGPAVLQSEYPEHFFASIYNLAACVL